MANRLSVHIVRNAISIDCTPNFANRSVAVALSRTGTAAPAFWVLTAIQRAVNNDDMALIGLLRVIHGLEPRQDEETRGCFVGRFGASADLQPRFRYGVYVGR